MKLRTLLVISTAFIMASCHNKEISLDINKEPVMELYGEVLYQEDIEEAIPEGLSGSDSVNFIERLKKRWAIERLVYNNALNNIGNTEEINALTESYRKELIINEYLNKITTQNLEPISEDSLFSFYNKQKSNFLLTEPVAKGIFIKVPSSQNQAKLSKWLADINDENLENILLFCTKNAAYYQLFLDNWVPYNKLSEMLSKPVDSTDPILSRGTIVQQSADYTYYLKITGLCLAGSPQPFELVENDIKNIMTNKEKNEFIQKFHDRLYEKAISKGTITLYKNEK